MKRIIFIDPGEKCGWARADVDEHGNWENLRHGITPLKEMALALYSNQLASAQSDIHSGAWPQIYDVIGYEVFRIYRTHATKLIGSDVQTAQMVGMIRLIAWLSSTRLVSQGANVMAMAEKSAPAWLTKYLKKFPKAHDEAHDGSALLHLWQWTFKNYITEGTDAHTVTFG